MLRARLHACWTHRHMFISRLHILIFCWVPLLITGNYTRPVALTTFLFPKCRLVPLIPRSLLSSISFYRCKISSLMTFNTKIIAPQNIHTSKSIPPHINFSLCSRHVAIACSSFSQQFMQFTAAILARIMMFSQSLYYITITLPHSPRSLSQVSTLIHLRIDIGCKLSRIRDWWGLISLWYY